MSNKEASIANVCHVGTDGHAAEKKRENEGYCRSKPKSRSIANQAAAGRGLSASMTRGTRSLAPLGPPSSDVATRISERPSILRGRSERGVVGGGGWGDCGVANGRFLHRRNSSTSIDVAGNRPRHGRKQREHQSSDGLFGSFRRKSWDQTLSLQASSDDLDLDSSNNTGGLLRRASVSDYHQVFQQLKRENPTTSLGALQHKTMNRIAEQRAAQEAKERRLREEFQRQEEEERTLNQTLAKKYVDRWVGKIGPRRQHQDQDDVRGSFVSNASESENIFLTKESSVLRTSFLRRSLAGVNAPEPPGGRKRSSRRLSVDSSANTSFLSSSASNDEMMYVQARLLAGSGDDQGFNIAPKMSVGDLTKLRRGSKNSLDGDSSGGDGSESSLGALSNVSGLFVDADESVITALSARSRLSGLNRRSSAMGLIAGDDDEDTDDELSNKKTGWSASCPDDLWGPCDARSVARSEASDFMSESAWTPRSDGLIVDFVDRSTYVYIKYQHEKEDGLIVGFADRSDSSRDKTTEGVGLWEEELLRSNSLRGGDGMGFPMKPSPYGPVEELEKSSRRWFRRRNFLSGSFNARCPSSAY